MSTENIQKFLMPPEEGGAYTDEKLAALLAHAQDEKLSYWSCCCLVGIPTADHALRPKMGSILDKTHYAQRIHTRTELEVEAETEFAGFDGDSERRAAIIPLILAEMDRRERKKIAALPEYESDPRDEEAYWSDSLTEAERVNSIKGR